MIPIKYQLLEFAYSSGTNPFRKWLNSLPANIAARIQARLYAAELGNLGDWKSIGDGVFEMGVHLNPGYRIYFGRDGKNILLLLGGGTKRSQTRDIAKAKKHWREFKGDGHVTT